MGHLFAPSLKSEKWCLPDQCSNSLNKNMNLLFIYWFCSKCTMTNQEYINCIGENSSKWFLVNRCYHISNLNNLQRVVIEMTSQLHQVTQTKHKNKQTMETKETCFCKQSFIDRSFLVLEILRGHSVPSSPMATQAKTAHDE